MRVSAEDVLTKQQVMDDIVAALKDGGVIGYPTDTIYGLGCDALNAAAIDKLYQIKKRDRNQPVSIICTDLMDIHKYATIPGFAYQMIRNLLPGPYTFIFPLKNPRLKVLLGDLKNIAVRVPDNPICLQLTKALGHPLVTTSANISGKGSIYFPDVVEETFSNHLSFLIEDGVLISDPSSVVDLTKDVPRVLREGKGDVTMFL